MLSVYLDCSAVWIRIKGGKDALCFIPVFSVSLEKHVIFTQQIRNSRRLEMYYILGTYLDEFTNVTLYGHNVMQ